jgi:hypothetical protein
MHGRRHFELTAIGATKTDPEVGRGRLEGKRYFVAGVKTYSDAGNLTTKSALCVH